MLTELILGGLLLTAMAGVSVLVLRHLSVKRNYRRQGLVTATAAGFTGTYTAAFLYLLSGSGTRVISFIIYITLIKYLYGIGWRESLNVFSKIFLAVLGSFIVAAGLFYLGDSLLSLVL